MPVRKQQGILDPLSNPVSDADIIMTAAVLGHSFHRINSGKSCRYDVEIRDSAHLSKNAIQNQYDDLGLHSEVVRRINKAFTLKGMPVEKATVAVGITPIYDQLGNIRITGGTGDLPLNDPKRYTPPLPTGLAKDLYYMATTTPGISSLLGYQGRGAYSGFVDGRKGGQTGLMTTFRHKMPVDDNNKRWIPSAVVPGSKPVGTANDDTHKIWGMLFSNIRQHQSFPNEQPPYVSLADNGMYFQDEDKARGFSTPLTENDIVGYTHGMIQAIYDVVWRNGGVPYEIAVGTQTTKLASCFTCSIFMEATGFPASSTHLGRGESWAPLYPDPPKLPTNKPTTLDTARKQCNDKWAAYCQTILSTGLSFMTNANVMPDHQASLVQMGHYLSNNKGLYDSANLILDAVTVHDSEYKRILRTLSE